MIYFNPGLMEVIFRNSTQSVFNLLSAVNSSSIEIQLSDQAALYPPPPPPKSQGVERLAAPLGLRDVENGAFD